jgi:hypothetical protein
MGFALYEGGGWLLYPARHFSLYPFHMIEGGKDDCPRTVVILWQEGLCLTQNEPTLPGGAG